MVNLIWFNLICLLVALFYGQQVKARDSSPLHCSHGSPTGEAHPAVGCQHRKDIFLLEKSRGGP